MKDRTSGIVKIKLGEKEVKFCFDFNAICWIQEAYDEDFDELQKQFIEMTTVPDDENIKFDFLLIRKLIGAGLQINAIEQDKDEYTKLEIKKLISGVDPLELAEAISVGFLGQTIPLDTDLTSTPNESEQIPENQGIGENS